jgi:SpoIID/LytB domain protein
VTISRKWRGIAAVAGVLTLVAVVAPSPAPAHADDGTVTFVGHGYGHGRGMSQYGAYGWAVNSGSPYDQILAFYYGGTTLRADAGNPPMTVELTRVTGGDTIVTGNGLMINDIPVSAAAVRIQRTGLGTFQPYSAIGCGGPWTVWGGVLGSGLTIKTTGEQSNLGNLPQVCEPTKSTGYRGWLTVVDRGNTQFTLNNVMSEDYLRGVVPREMPASWGAAGSGRGMQALMTQAVAARSYALGSGARPTSGASTCDSDSCQVYGGAFEQPNGAAIKPLEDARSDTAVQATAGQVMRSNANGTIARTEFSSSNGGWSAGGTFPAVPDSADATPNNPNHNWTTTLSLASVAAALGTGQIRSMDVTARNGLGAEGGRALTVVVTQVGGATASFSGDTVRLRLGLKSNWFTPVTSSVAAAQAVIKALYQDVLGRGPDPQGLANWTNIVLVTGNPRLIADGIVNSPERLAALVAAEYTPAVHRAPEPGGIEHWVAYLQRGATVSDLQIGVFASDESLNVLGGGDVTTWVAAMYAAILGRGASPEEAAMWAQVAARGGREAAVAGIARSPEAGTRRLQDYYLRYLGRGLDPSGLASWLPAMSGRGDFTIPGMIGGSQEYWDKAQIRFP